MTTNENETERHDSRPLRILWWVAAFALTAGVFIWLDRTDWVDGLAETTQTAVRVGCGIIIFSLAAAGDRGRRRARA